MFALVALLACSSDDTGKDTAPGIGDNTGDDCSGAAPVIDAFTIEEGDVITNEDGQEQPSLNITVEFEDDDWDLNTVTMNVWFDDTVDGSVDTTGDAPISTGEYQMEDGTCSVSGGSFTLAQGIVGDPLAYDTEYEFGAVIVDQHGLESDPAITSATTPSEL